MCGVNGGKDGTDHFKLIPKPVWQEEHENFDGSVLPVAGATLFQYTVYICTVGLDAAGKTTILYKLKLGEIVTTIPTIGELKVATIRQFLADSSEYSWGCLLGHFPPPRFQCRDS